MNKKGTSSHRASRKGIFLRAPRINNLSSLCCLCWLWLTATSCQDQPTQATVQTNPVQEDLFPDKAQVHHARGFTLSYHGNYKVVNILNHFENQTDTLKYVLVQRGTPPPSHFPLAQIIEIPVRTLVGMSSMHVGLAEFAESANVLVGLGDLQYVSSKRVRENVAAGKVKEVGIGGALNEELLIAMQPDLVMAMGSPDASFYRYQTLAAAGIPVLVNTEWLENTPLGRAEWVKVMAALLNQEKVVNAKFDLVDREYRRLATLGRQAENKPTIITGMPFKGTWTVPDGDSFMTRFLIDAGTTYPWEKEVVKGSLQLNFESVAPVALQADFWLNPGSVDSKADLLAKDVRFSDFKPYRQNTIFNNNKRINDKGANDFWESGVVNPHLILADLLKILHPEVLPDHELVYHKQLF